MVAQKARRRFVGMAEAACNAWNPRRHRQSQVIRYNFIGLLNFLPVHSPFHARTRQELRAARDRAEVVSDLGIARRLQAQLEAGRSRALHSAAAAERYR